MNFSLEPGASATFRYRIVVLEGVQGRRAEIVAAIAQFDDGRRRSMIHVGLIGAGNISDTHAARPRPMRRRARGGGVRADARSGGATRGRRRRRRRTIRSAAPRSPADGYGAIGSPSGLHAEQGIAAARAGCTCLLKSRSTSPRSAPIRLIAEAARAGVTLGVIFQDRTKPDVAAPEGARRRRPSRHADSRLGEREVAPAAASTTAASAWRGTRALDGGGALMNQGVHTVDLLLWLFGPVRRVFGKVATRLHAIEVEDTAVATLEFASGAIGTIEAATSAYPGYRAAASS